MAKQKYIYLDDKKIPFTKQATLKSGFVDSTIVLTLCPELKKYYGTNGAMREGNIIVPGLDIEIISHEVSHAVFWLISDIGAKQIEVDDHLSDEFVAYMQGFLTEKIYRKVKEWLK
jgi:hypothetical protein